MISKAFFILFCIYCVNGHYFPNDFKIIDSITQEEPCLRQGGMCTIAVDCPAGRLTERRGLCPTQKSLGVECCYGISVKETRCSRHGGQCNGPAYCNPRLIYRQATDCPRGSQCCILVR